MNFVKKLTKEFSGKEQLGSDDEETGDQFTDTNRIVKTKINISVPANKGQNLPSNPLFKVSDSLPQDGFINKI